MKNKKTFIGIILLVLFLVHNFTLPKRLSKKHTPLDKIYIINLDKNKDRLDKISTALAKQNLPFERFKAVNGYELKIEDEKGRIFYGKDLKSGKASFRIGEKYKIYCPNITMNYEFKPSAYPSRGDSLKIGEFGCMCSHLEVMFDVMKNKYKFAIVFEDDAAIPNDFADIVAKMEDNMPYFKDYDILYMGYSQRKSLIHWDKDVLFNNLIRKVNMGNNNEISYMHAIAYSYYGASNMLGYVKTDKAIDTAVSDAIIEGKISAYKLRNYNIPQDNSFSSEITNMGDR